ncbi:CelD/BcsL family acetyltransferase involved in cellulose biosynthesis [Catenulispora sp. MAP5-51]|uniref:GNAT family N-acetyltransferase n=1 Tax=Catenulispora sp. MAP5-51 TaxID=3156298 RepID=UPI0035141008
MAESTSRDTGWTADVTSGAEALDALGAEWDRLFLRCSAATPFQSRIWLSSWCRWYGPASGRLRVVSVRYRGVLVGGAALVLTRQWLWRVLRPVGVEQSDFCDVLVDDSGDGVPDARAIVGRLAAAIRGELRFDVLDFPDVRPGSVLARVRDGWRGAAMEVPGEVCLSLPGVPMGEHVESIETTKLRQQLRRRLRELDRVGLEARLIPSAEAEDAMARFLELHRQQWADRPVNTEHLTERFRGHLTTVLRASTEAGETVGFQAVLAEFSLKNKDTLEVEHVASDLLVVGRSMVGGYLYGYLPTLRSRVDVSVALTRAAMTMAAERGIPELSLLRGTEPHKYRLSPNEVRSVRIVLANGFWGAAGLGAIRGRALTSKAVKRLRLRLIRR